MKTSRRRAGLGAERERVGTPKDMMITSWLNQLEDWKSADIENIMIAVPGIRLAGWWPGELPDLDLFRKLEIIWPKEATTIKQKVDGFEERDGRKHRVSAYVRVLSYPQTWIDTITSSLRFFVACGAAISWAGGWECFLQYSPTEPLLGCYAAYTTGTGLICGGDLNDPLVCLDKIPGAIKRLHSAVGRARAGEPRPD